MAHHTFDGLSLPQPHQMRLPIKERANTRADFQFKFHRSILQNQLMKRNLSTANVHKRNSQNYVNLLMIRTRLDFLDGQSLLKLHNLLMN